MMPNFGRYEIIAEIGRGATATVYSARDRLLGRDVAVKALDAAQTEVHTRELHACFDREARVVRAIEHPNIVSLYDSGQRETLSYLVMELLDGQPLSKLLQARGRLPPDTAVDLAAQLADALDHLHWHGVTHGDVKPANIVVTEDGRGKIVDFGLASLRDSAPENAPLRGSPRYMSPEHVLRKRVDARSDVFCLGVVLYEMLTGRQAFAAADLNSILFAIVGVDPPAPSTVPGVPPILDEVIGRAIAKRRDARHATAGELAAELRSCTGKLDATPRLCRRKFRQPLAGGADPYAGTLLRDLLANGSMA